MHRVRAFFLFFLLILLPGFSNAQNLPNHIDPNTRQETFDSADVPTIRFLSTSSFPPFNYRDEVGKLIGFNVDLALAICANLEISCTMQAWPWEQAGDALEDLQGDALITGLAITPENGARFDFSQIYLMLPGRFIAKQDQNITPEIGFSADELIGVRAGSNHLKFLQRYFPEANRVEFASEFEALDALEKEEVSVYFGDGMRASFWLREHPDCCAFIGEAYFNTELFSEGLAIAFPAGQDLVRNAVNTALSRLSQNGTLDELYLRWFPIGFY